MLIAAQPATMHRPPHRSTCSCTQRHLLQRSVLVIRNNAAPRPPAASRRAAQSRLAAATHPESDAADAARCRGGCRLSATDGRLRPAANRNRILPSAATADGVPRQPEAHLQHHSRAVHRCLSSARCQWAGPMHLLGVCAAQPERGGTRGLPQLMPTSPHLHWGLRGAGPGGGSSLTTGLGSYSPTSAPGPSPGPPPTRAHIRNSESTASISCAKEYTKDLAIGSCQWHEPTLKL